jgi:SAM-dependent methyltransferase
MTDYKLFTSPDPPHNGKVYYIANNVKRWIPSGDHVKVYNLKWEDVTQVSAEILNDYALSAPLAKPGISYSEDLSIWDMHELLGSELSGKGVEFGAAFNPFPCSINCEVEYADLFDHSSSDSPYFNKAHHTNIEYVKCSYQTSIAEMDGINDDSLDFLIACHVIEHVSNPLQAIESAWNKLKSGGKLVLVVPHKDLTFDKNRKLTELDHLILDYERPFRERDFFHLVDFYEKAFVTPDPYRKAQEVFFNPQSDIHYHTWNESTFLEMVTYFSNHIKPWSNITYYPHLKHPDANEFYFMLEK